MENKKFTYHVIVEVVVEAEKQEYADKIVLGNMPYLDITGFSIMEGAFKIKYTKIIKKDLVKKADF